ncbi:hypothetical protein LAZ67_2005831 [Cordylochernes scorpioides]|uniref:Reverse transcriptase Ty1/copia-type domain-containing protein n=1 Tax=Cordylochernes scorpioides TaxID=51811 RepID=A0ABY6K7M5_9ARAC|nr:hypothetical protein LAZ67_2005831 [Cordylochernes scorpioides]
MARANRRITLEEIEDGLNEDCSHFSVHKIVSETLGYRKVSARSLQCKFVHLSLNALFEIPNRKLHLYQSDKVPNIRMKDNETVDEYITRAKNIAARSSSLGHQFPSRELSFHIVRGIHPRSVKFSEDKRGIDYANDIQEDTYCDNLTYKGNCEEIVAEDFLILKEDNPVTESKMKSQEDTSVKLGGDCENDSSQTEPIQERCVKGGRKKGETKSILEERYKARLEEQERKLIEEGVRRSQRIKDRNNANLIMEIDHYIPENFKEAMDSGERNEWHKAMEDELSEIEKHKVWTLVPRENGKCWNKKIIEILYQLGMIRTKCDPCVYKLQRGEEYAILGLYVDDLIIAGTSKEINDNLASEIEKYVTLTEKKDSEPIIGIEIKREEDGFYLSQTHYIDTILHRFGLEECNSVQTPGDQNQNLDEYLDSKPVDKTVYQEMIGSLMYLSTGTRPDISFNVSNLSQYSNDPREIHLTVT